MLKEIEDRVGLGVKKLNKAFELLGEKRKEARGECLVTSALVLRPGLIEPEAAAKAMALEKAHPQIVIEALGIEKDRCLAYRVTPRKRGLFERIINDERIAGVIAFVPCSFEGIKGSQKKGMIPKTRKSHAIAILGKTRDIEPRLYKASRKLGREMPKRGLKKKRKRQLTTINVNREDILQYENGKHLLKEMARIPGLNTIVLLEPGFKFDWEKREIVPEK